MARSRVNLVSVITAILVGIGALVSSFAAHLSVLWGISGLSRSMILQDPLGWALRPGASPIAVLGMLFIFILLVGLTWLFVRLVVGSALPGKGAAVFFGSWGAVIIASVIAGFVRAPIMMATLRMPTGDAGLMLGQFQQFSLMTVSWAIMWGWIVAVVAALSHRTITGVPRDAHPGRTDRYTPTQYAPAQVSAPPRQYQPGQAVPQYAPAPQVGHGPGQFSAPPSSPEQPSQYPGDSA